jgi:6-phosphogluconate dehydrogenase
MLAPMVALMRLPLMAAEAGNTGKWAAESALAINEKVTAVAEGMFAAHMSLLGSAAQFWPEVLAGKTPSVLNGVAAERSFDAALGPVSRRVAANFRRLSKTRV